MSDLDKDNKNRQFWTEFFQLYKENPCLWDDFRDPKKKSLRELSLNLLLEKYWELDADGTIEAMKRRIQLFRSGFRREYRRVQEAKKSGISFTPKLWYYNLLKFLSVLQQMSWSLRAKCAMYGCMNATYNKLGSGMLFHRFPKNPERQYLWKLRCQNPRIMEKYHKCLFVCGAHFDKSCYHGHNQHLKPDAIPCINLPAVGNGLMSYEQAKNEMETNSSATAADEESSLSKYSHQRKNLDISSSEDGDSDDEVQLDQEEYESIKLEPGLSDARRNSLHSPIPGSSPPIPVEPVYQNLPVISHVHTVADTPALRPISRSGASMVFNYQRNSQHSPGPTVSPPVPTEPAYQTLPDISNVQQPTQHLRASSAAINVGDIDETEDDCSTFAAHVKMKMRKFDTIQKHIAQKLISDIMFMADTRQLQLTTAIINTQAPRIGPHLVVGDSRQLQITSNMINNRPQVPQAVQTSQIRQGSAPPQFKPAFPTIVATQPAQTYQVTQVAEVKEAPKPQTVSNGTSKMMTGSFSAYLVDSESDDDDTPLTKRRK